MPLKRARDYYAGLSSCFNPLWQRVGPHFNRMLVSGPNGRTGENAELYVRERVAEGVTEEDIAHHVRADDERVFVVEGPAGVGKTTFLEHVVFPLARASPDLQVVWVDVMRLVDQPGSKELYPAVEAFITRELQAAIAEKLGEPSAWFRFLVEHWTDPLGEVDVLRQRLRGAGPLEGEVLADLQRLLRGARFLDVTRIRLRCLRRTLGLRPVIVLDNVDRLHHPFQLALLRLALALAAGSGGGEDHAAVLIALRPETLSENVRPRDGTAVFHRGTLHAPKVGALLRARMSRFLETWSGPIAKGPQLAGERHRAVDLRELSAEPGELPDDVARRLLSRITDALLDAGTFESHAETLQTLAGYNTRLVLLAAGGYVASGHHDFERWRRHGFADAEIRGSLTRRRVFKALLLGTQAVFQGRQSWAYNVFADGNADVVGTVGTLRILKQVKRLGASAGLTPGAVAGNLEALFGYPPERVQRRVAELRVAGLLEERFPDHFGLTACGDAYLRIMPRDFEYLQHVLIDTWVNSRHLVECRERDEPAPQRFLRVLQFARWMRDVEVEECARVARARQEELYQRCYGEDTISGTLADALAKVLPDLPGSATWSGGASNAKAEVERLRSTSTFAAIRRDALAAAVDAGAGP